MSELLLLLSAAPAAVQAVSAGELALGASGMTIQGGSAPFTGRFYAIVFNSGAGADRLLNVTMPAAAKVTPAVIVYDDKMQVQAQEDARALPPGARIMVVANVADLDAAEFPGGVPVTLEFEQAGRLSVIVWPHRADLLPPPVAAR